jgi:hypothetical protein
VAKCYGHAQQFITSQICTCVAMEEKDLLNMNEKQEWYISIHCIYTS